MTATFQNNSLPQLVEVLGDFFRAHPCKMTIFGLIFHVRPGPPGDLLHPQLRKDNSGEGFQAGEVGALDPGAAGAPGGSRHHSGLPALLPVRSMTLFLPLWKALWMSRPLSIPASTSPRTFQLLCSCFQGNSRALVPLGAGICQSSSS